MCYFIFRKEHEISPFHIDQLLLLVPHQNLRTGSRRDIISMQDLAYKNNSFNAWLHAGRALEATMLPENPVIIKCDDIDTWVSSAASFVIAKR